MTRFEINFFGFAPLRMLIVFFLEIVFMEHVYCFTLVICIALNSSQSIQQQKMSQGQFSAHFLFLNQRSSLESCVDRKDTDRVKVIEISFVAIEEGIVILGHAT